MTRIAPACTPRNGASCSTPRNPAALRPFSVVWARGALGAYAAPCHTGAIRRPPTAALVLAGVCVGALRSRPARGAVVGLGLVAGGGFANWIDRLLHQGAVTDFAQSTPSQRSRSAAPGSSSTRQLGPNSIVARRSVQ